MNLELDTKQEILLDEIKQSEEKILEISILGEFETAKAYKARLENIKNRVSLYYSKNSIPGLSYEEASIIKDLTYLEYDIKIFFIEKGNALKQKQKIDEYKKKINAILENIQGKTTEELWETLLHIANDWKAHTTSAIELEMGKRKIANIVLKIIEIQISRNEMIDFNKIEQYCDYPDFLFVLKEKLLNIAQKQDIDEQKKTLSILKNLDIHNLTNPDLWYMLTFKRDIQFVQMHNEASNNEYYLLTGTSMPAKTTPPEENRLSEQTGLTEKSLSIILSDIMTRLYLRLTRKIYTGKMQNLYMD